MMDNRLSVIFIWHMHQPYYKDLVTGRYAMPWVRLHGIKDYYDMAHILRDFPRVRQNFNLVPSLIDQIIDIGENDAKGIYLDHSVKPAAELDKNEKVFVLRNFFLANWDNMIKPYPRYWELLLKRGRDVSDLELGRMARYFSDHDFLDLQVWFNLAWFDPIFKDNDPFLKDLIRKGRDFTEEEKLGVINKQKQVMRLILPEYKELWDAGRLELSATPYYHPILPLLCDTEIAKISNPQINLPMRFQHPEDAKTQVSRALSRFNEVFGRRPKGMWPSEGSVSEGLIPIMADEGVEWIATDEEVLAKSLDMVLDRDFSGVSKKPEILYRAYKAQHEGRSLNIFFRDHTLSDLFGFVYSKWDPKNAVDDFINRLARIRKDLNARGQAGVVTIILDGENAWEHYRNDGHDFLYMLYDRLSREEQFDCTTVSEYLAKGPKPDTLPKLFPGSWINHNFNIWIGHEEDNAAWDAVSRTRQDLIEFASGETDPEKLRLAWEEIYIAEGSDWCWWYGDDHSSENDREFDELFRKHLINVYELLDKTPPDYLFISIIREDRKSRPTVELTAFISPTLDGEITSYYEWLSAGFYDVSQAGGTMHRAESIVSHIYYGFDPKNLFIRIDSNRNLNDPNIKELTFSVHFLRPSSYRLDIRLDPEQGKVNADLIKVTKGEEAQSGRHSNIAAREIIELAMPFDVIMAKPGDEINFFVTVRRDDVELEKWPYRGYISLEVPTEDFEAIMWHV
ncbi:MAG: glycoside hydrolase family 57 protein [Nitrospirota bacterium]